MSRRMFSDEITSTDAFLDLPKGSQLLYFHLGMSADDDGFVANPKMIMRVIGSSEDELRVLFAKKFLLAFDNGVCVVKHWRINNYIRKDIYKETKYIKEKSSLFIRENGSYSFNPDNAILVPKGHFTIKDKEFVDASYTNRTLSIGKVRIGKVSKDKSNTFKKPSLEEIKEYCLERTNTVDANRFFDFYESKGWLVGKNKMKDWKASVRTWEKNNFDKPKIEVYKNKSKVNYAEKLKEKQK